MHILLLWKRQLKEDVHLLENIIKIKKSPVLCVEIHLVNYDRSSGCVSIHPSSL